jgi:hypothetical protein
MISKKVILIIIFFIFSSNNIFADDVKNSKIFGVIPKDKIEYGCGCSYSLESNTSKEFQPIFQSELDYSYVIMFIKGKLVKLEPIKTHIFKSRPKLGDKFTLQFKYNDLFIVFNNTVTFVCPPDSEGGCEVTRFKAELTVNNGKIKEVYSVNGDCGC